MSKENIILKRNFGKITNWINGQSVTTGNMYSDVFTPYTGEVIGQVPMSTEAETLSAIKIAKEAFTKWGQINIKERVQIMYKLKSLMERDLEEMKQIIALENGKTLIEAHGDVAKGIEVLEFACSIPNLINGKTMEVASGIFCQTLKAPLGVVASICPFNFPVMVPMWTIPIALTVGNTMILKPSEQVPFGAMKIAQLLKEAGLPDGVFNIVHGNASVVETLCDHEDIKAISFVGSSKVAKLVYARAAQNGKRALALGGAKNHLILMPDAALESAPKQIVDSAMGCSGQRCMAASVLITVGDCQNHIDKMVEYTKSIKLGVDQGSIINQVSVERIHQYINQAQEMGAKLLVDGRNKTPENKNVEGSKLDNGYWVGPTLIDEVKENFPVATDEVFGPVLAIIRVNSLEEALKIENNNPYGNAASIFTTNGASATYFTKNASAGMNGVNIGIPVPREPFGFGGWNESRFGHGDITGVQGIDFWTKDRKVTTKFIEPHMRNWMS